MLKPRNFILDQHNSVGGDVYAAAVKNQKNNKPAGMILFLIAMNFND